MSRAGLAGDGWTVVLTCLLLWPQHGAGFGLGRDMVFTPRQPLTAAAVGLGSGSPRAVPLDAVVSLATHLIGGMAAGRLALLLPLLMVGWGARRLLHSSNLAANLVVPGFAVWNPFVVERLAIGQWALLWAYAASVWLVIVCRRLRARDRSAGTPWVLWCAALVALAAAAVTPTGGLLGAAVFVTLAWEGRSRATLCAVGAALLVQLPWLVPSVLLASGVTSDPAAVTVFASKAEHGGGVLPTLVGLGGIWDRDSTPASRSGPLGLLTAVVVVLGIGLGVTGLAQRLGRRLTLRLVALAGLGLFLAALAALPGGAVVLRWAVATVPGAGLFRDGQKWLIPFVLLAVLCLGPALERMSQLGRSAAVVTVAAGLCLPVILLPDATRTVLPTMMPSAYPRDWYVASRILDDQDSPGAVLALPFASYRNFSWVAARSVIDPVARWLDRPSVVDDQLVVSGRVLAGEDPRAAAVGATLRAARAEPAALAVRLAAQGIGWVWLERDTAGPAHPPLTSLTLVRAGRSVSLYRVPDPITADPVSAARRAVVTGLDLIVALALVGASSVLTGASVRACYTRRQGRTGRVAP